MVVVTGSHYLGGFIRYKGDKYTWIADKVQGWAELVETLLGVSRKHLQSTYKVLQNSLQREWEFVQRVTPDIGDASVQVEHPLREAFIPALFQGVR